MNYTLKTFVPFTNNNCQNIKFSNENDRLWHKWASGYQHTEYHTKWRIDGEWILKLMVLAKMTKFTVTVRNNNLTKFLAAWRPLLDLQQDKDNINFLQFENYIRSESRNVVDL